MRIIGCCIAICRDSSRFTIDGFFDRTFRLEPPVIFTKLQRRLLIKLVRNIESKCIKHVNVFGDGGWDLGCMRDVNVRDMPTTYYYYYCSVIELSPPYVLC